MTDTKEATVILKVEGSGRISLKTFNGTIYDIDLESKNVADLYSTYGLFNTMQETLDKQFYDLIVKMNLYPKVRY